MSFLYELDDMREKIFIFMKNFENDSLIEKIVNLMKMMNRNREHIA